MKTCKDCGNDFEDDEFYLNTLRRGSKVYKIRRPRCPACHNKHALSRASSLVNRQLAQYRKRAKKAGLSFDLDKPFVQAALASPCHYCERAGRPMSMDRSEPTEGYTKSNCVPACMQCNRIKSDLSLAAWNHILPSIRSAVALGLM